MSARAYKPQSSEPNGFLSLLLPGNTPFTTLMMLFCAGFFALTAIQAGGVGGQGTFNLLRAGANHGSLVFAAGEWWRLITYAYLHGDITHILFNLYALFIVGRLVEMRFGPGRTAIVYVLSAIGGGLASAAAGHAVSVGASGAVTGLIGAGIVITSYIGTDAAKRVRNQLIMWLVITTAVGLLGGFGGGKVDHLAHFGGVAVGALTTFVLLRIERRTRRKSRRAASPAENAIGTVLVVGSVLAMIAQQFAVRNIPTVKANEANGQETVARQLWDDCDTALDGDLADAIAPCRDYQLPVLYDAHSVVLLLTLYEIDGNERGVARQQRILRSLDAEMVDLRLPPQERVEVIRTIINYNPARQD